MAFDAGLADRIRGMLPQDRAIAERRMFGGLAFLYHGHMFCGVTGADLMLRLGDAGATEALKQPHTRPMDFTGKPLKSMIYVAAKGIDREAALQAWIERALRFARTLPPKK